MYYGLNQNQKKIRRKNMKKRTFNREEIFNQIFDISNHFNCITKKVSFSDDKAEETKNIHLYEDNNFNKKHKNIKKRRKQINEMVRNI